MTYGKELNSKIKLLHICLNHTKFGEIDGSQTRSSFRIWSTAIAHFLKLGMKSLSNKNHQIIDTTPTLLFNSLIITSLPEQITEHARI